MYRFLKLLVMYTVQQYEYCDSLARGIYATGVCHRPFKIEIENRKLDLQMHVSRVLGMLWAAQFKHSQSNTQTVDPES